MYSFFFSVLFWNPRTNTIETEFHYMWMISSVTAYQNSNFLAICIKKMSKPDLKNNTLYYGAKYLNN